ncbi:MAG: glycosyltransferase [Desulfobacteraceae bacterium]|nr:MAG: glycosyltransferase [Desulfobacteraceae bacterium]
MEILEKLLLFVYFGTAFVLMIYGINCYVMVYLYLRGQKRARQYRTKVSGMAGRFLADPDLPFVTTQIPVFNEFNVVERVVRAACRMDYPLEKHEIQILDDSTDGTVHVAHELTEELKKQGFHIRHIQRKRREGFKAGALAEGLRQSSGELIAIFDADFVPPENFLSTVVPYFLMDQELGLVQARWGHLNRKRSLLTRVQSIGIDGHFMIEQSARYVGNLFMNFNGTAGMWRKSAIHDGGGWSWDTLTEDMDLSYRVQLAGWKTMFLPDLVVPAEIPENINAFKSQQFRWAKGSIQTAIKLLPGLLRSPAPFFKKVEAFFHLTHYLVHPMMLILSLLAFPVIRFVNYAPGPTLFFILAWMLAVSMAAPGTLYVVSQRAAYPDWKKRILVLPFLVMVGVGIAVSNSKAVAEALLGWKSEFLRTPKKGDIEVIRYQTMIPWTGALEMIVGVYCTWSFGYYLFAEKYLVGYFLSIYAFGFLFTGLLSITQSIPGFRK